MVAPLRTPEPTDPRWRRAVEATVDGCDACPDPGRCAAEGACISYLEEEDCG
ncbi:MAG: hypothetical protein ACXVXP_00385 [Mycobacteriaceae bacterium]